ncbi:MAG: mechanosensitive ion channel family protein [Actinomycetota bacterium]|nr:mechanosensitive ion channel family protein [Actinomycetota bacterium]
MEHGYLYELLRKLGLNDFWASTGEFLLVRPLKIVAIVVAVTLLSRIGGRAIRRFVRDLHARSPLIAGRARAEQRAQTVGDALAGLLHAVLWAVGALLVLDQLGVSLAPLLAGAGIAGVAVGFGAQALVRDFLSGLFILIEDQYGVGDVVELGGHTGTVEDLSLRVSRIRGVDGTVWFVPNGELRVVGNTSMEWSRAVVDIPIPPDSDAGRATELIAEEARAMADEEAWGRSILEPPEVWGVQAIDKDSLTIRAVVKTAPRQQHVVARELRGRISRRLREDRAA